MTTSTITKNAYAYDRLRIAHVIEDMLVHKHEPKPGSKIQAFDFPTTDGGRFTSADLKKEAKAALLIFGSNTCPVTESSAEGIKSLYTKYGDKVRFVMIKSREAHPGASLLQAHTFDEKFNQAIRLKEHHNFPFKMAVDDENGTFHQSLDARPNSVYIVDPSGVILFHAQWGTETIAIGKALEAIVAGEEPPKPFVSNTMLALLKTMGYGTPVLKTGGKGAYSQMATAFPPGALMMRMSDLFFFLPRNKRGLPSMLLTMGLMTAVIVGIVTYFL